MSVVAVNNKRVTVVTSIDNRCELCRRPWMNDSVQGLLGRKQCPKIDVKHL